MTCIWSHFRWSSSSAFSSYFYIITFWFEVGISTASMFFTKRYTTRGLQPTCWGYLPVCVDVHMPVCMAWCWKAVQNVICAGPQFPHPQMFTGPITSTKKLLNTIEPPVCSTVSCVTAFSAISEYSSQVLTKSFFLPKY